jgi:hypothetical protein
VAIPCGCFAIDSDFQAAWSVEMHIHGVAGKEGSWSRALDFTSLLVYSLMGAPALRMIGVKDTAMSGR